MRLLYRLRFAGQALVVGFCAGRPFLRAALRARLAARTPACRRGDAIADLRSAQHRRAAIIVAGRAGRKNVLAATERNKRLYPRCAFRHASSPSLLTPLALYLRYCDATCLTKRLFTFLNGTLVCTWRCAPPLHGCGTAPPPASNIYWAAVRTEQRRIGGTTVGSRGRSAVFTGIFALLWFI